MRLHRADGSTVHVSYCTNVHPALDLDGVLDQLRRYAVPVRDRLGVDRLGVGLWLAAPLARALDEAGGDGARRLRDDLDALGLECVTLNAFPYGDFHGQRDKRAVYHPDWTRPERLEHTLACARVLARLLPDDVRSGAVSTLPLAWRDPWDDDRARAAADHLATLARGLHDLAATGPTVRVGLEPEPGCVWQVLDDVLHPATGLAALLDGRDPDRLVGVCLDTCHSAVGFDDLADAADRLAVAPVDVVKLQASAAVHVAAPASPGARAALAELDEPRFLHQTRERRPDGPPLEVDDLPQARDALPAEGPWRVHLHAPLHGEPVGDARPETGPLTAALDGLVRPGAVDVVEVETYTWSVLPPARRGDDGVRPPDGPDGWLVAGVAAELAWVADHLGRGADAPRPPTAPLEVP